MIRSMTSAPAVPTSRANSSNPASVTARVEWGEGHPDQDDALPDRAGER